MNPIRAWNRFWFAPISARPLGAYRIVFGILVLVHLLLISVDLDYWYTDAGVLRGTEARELAGPLRFSPLQWYQDPATVHAGVRGDGRRRGGLRARLANPDHERPALPRPALALPQERRHQLRPRRADDGHDASS